MIMWQEMKLNCLMIITEAVQGQGGRASSTTEELGAGLFRGKGSRDKTKPRTDTVTTLTTLYKYVQSGYGHGPSSSSASSTWKAKYQLCKLASYNNEGSVGPRNSTGLLHQICRRPLPASQAPPTHSRAVGAIA